MYGRTDDIQSQYRALHRAVKTRPLGLRAQVGLTVSVDSLYIGTPRTCSVPIDCLPFKSVATLWFLLITAGGSRRESRMLGVE